jgi:GAF domain-containing protein
LPIKIRGAAIGAIRLDKPKGAGQWTADDNSLANSLAEQLGGALDSARLFSDISQRAELERIISEATSRIGSKIDIDAILQSTVAELGNLIGDSEVTIQIQPSGMKEE